MQTTADAETHSAPRFSSSPRGMTWSQRHRRMAGTERCGMRSPRWTWNATLRHLMETPWRTSGSLHPRGAVSRSRRQHDEEEYIEDVHQGVLGGAYLDEPRAQPRGR